MGSDEYALSRSVIWTESNRPISLHSTLYLPLRWMWVKWRQLHKLSYLRQFQQSTPNKRNSSQQKLRMCCEHMRIDVKRCRPTHTRTRKSWSTQSLRTGRRTRPNRNTSSDEGKNMGSTMTWNLLIIYPRSVCHLGRCNWKWIVTRHWEPCLSGITTGRHGKLYKGKCIKRKTNFLFIHLCSLIFHVVYYIWIQHIIQTFCMLLTKYVLFCSSAQTVHFYTLNPACGQKQWHGSNSKVIATCLSTAGVHCLLR